MTNPPSGQNQWGSSGWGGSDQDWPSQGASGQQPGWGQGQQGSSQPSWGSSQPGGSPSQSGWGSSQPGGGSTQSGWGSAQPGWGSASGGSTSGGSTSGWPQPGQAQGHPQWGQPGQGPGGAPGPGGQPPKGGSKLPLVIGAGVLAFLVLAGVLWLVLDPSKGNDVPPPPPPTTTGPVPTAKPSPTRTTRTPTTAPPTEIDPYPTGPTTPPQVINGEIGKPIPIKSYNGSAGEIIIHSVNYSNEGIIPPDNGSYLNLDVEFKSTSGSLRYGSMSFRARDDAGHEYMMGIGSRATPRLSVGTLPAGQNVRGWVSLDTPRAPLNVVVTNDLMEPVAMIKVAP